MHSILKQITALLIPKIENAIKYIYQKNRKNFCNFQLFQNELNLFEYFIISRKCVAIVEYLIFIFFN